MIEAVFVAIILGVLLGLWLLPDQTGGPGEDD